MTLRARAFLISELLWSVCAGIFEGIAQIEARSYRLLHTMGARPPVTKVFTTGGGAQNDKWSAIRSKAIGVPVVQSPQGKPSTGKEGGNAGTLNP